MSIVSQLKNARLATGASLRKTADAAGLCASNLSEIENGRRDPRAATVRHIADALGYQIIAIPGRQQTTAARAARTIAAEANEWDAYRVFIQLSDDLATVDGTTRVLLTAEKPLSTGTRWDDAIAGLVEHRLQQVGAPVPEWVRDSPGQPDHSWQPQRSHAPITIRPDVALVPESFRRRGVLIEESELASV